MAFKGGTSLSKVYNAIFRFSEGVDITIAHNALDDSIDPFNQSSSRNARSRYSDTLKGKVATHVTDVVAPYTRGALDAELGLAPDAVELDPGNPENVFIHYPSAFDAAGDYLVHRVKVEFGGRNTIIPNEAHTIRPYVAEHAQGLAFPQAQVHVLAAERTFWEKATLIHAACGRPLRQDSSRQSRHWYDLDRLAQSDIGARSRGPGSSGRRREGEEGVLLLVNRGLRRLSQRRTAPRPGRRQFGGTRTRLHGYV